MELAELRRRIDALDMQIVRLINERAEHAQQIGRAKDRSDAPAYAPERERQVLQKVAAASAGPLWEGYGTPRDQVLGLQLVTGDGRILELGGRVMKNVAGYDLVKLVVGSRGTLGIVTRVDLRLRALPECDWTIALGAESPAPLIELAAALREEWVAPVALELVSPAAWRGVEGRVAGAARSGLPGGGRVAAGPRGARPGAGDGWVLLVRLQGNADAVAAALGRVRGVAERVGIDAGTGADTYTHAVWAALDQLEAAAGLSVRLADRPAALKDTLRLALRLPGGEAGLPIVAHAGAGIVRVLAESEPERPVGTPVDEWVPALGAARAEITGRRGTLIVAKAPREITALFEPEGELDRGVLRLMHGIRERFDPVGTLAPQRSES
jgi:glycolate oxidase FAD binding subunit